MKIYLDAMGGDHAPSAPLEGALEALEKHSELLIEAAGPIEIIQAEVDRVFAAASPNVRNRLSLTDCPEIIENCEAPVIAVRKKKNSAIVDGMLKLRNGAVDAFVSAGSTGAVLAGGMFRLGRIPGIDRPALAPLLPNGKGFFLLIDCGANVDCRPEWLVQFGQMGTAYMQGVQGMPNPRVGLANNGIEAEKGNALAKDAHALLAASRLHFVGNVEAREITNDAADIIVCDGFIGNIILKFMEGVAGTLMRIIKREITMGFKNKMGALILKPAFKKVAKAMDYTEAGGAPLLGVRGAVVKAHGSSNAHSLACSIAQAVKMVETDVVGKIEKQLILSDTPSE